MDRIACPGTGGRAVRPLLVSAYADAMVYYVNTANKKSLNMRSSTDLGNNILTSIPNGAAVVVYEFLNSNTWAHIGYGGRDGYVMTRYLSLTPPSTQPSTAESLSFKDFKSTYYLASVKPSTPSGYVNMRWAPSSPPPSTTSTIPGPPCR